MFEKGFAGLAATSSMRLAARAGLMLALTVLAATSARADSVAELTVVPNATASVTATASAGTPFGTVSDSDSETVDVSGSAAATLLPTDPPWAGVELTNMALAFSEAQFTFTFGSFPFVINVDVTIEDLVLESTMPLADDLEPDGSATFVDAEFLATGMLTTVVGGTDPQTSELNAVNNLTFSGRIVGDEILMTATFDQLEIGDIVGDFPPEDLPDGINSLTVTLETSLSNVVFEGGYAEAASCGDGLCSDEESCATCSEDCGVCEGACCHPDGSCSNGPESACSVFVCDVTTNSIPECGGACGTTCFGDINGDGVVTVSDRGFISANLGTEDPALLCQCDLNGDGLVSVSDRGFVSANVGFCEPLPDYQDGSGMNDGMTDERFPAAFYVGDGTVCGEVSCVE